MWQFRIRQVGVRVRSFELTRGQAPLFVPQNFRSLQGFPVTVLDERGPWRGRITKVWRDCVEVKSVPTSVSADSSLMSFRHGVSKKK